MANRRTLSWSTALRDLRGERTRRAGVREERLRATAGLRDASLALSSWRGRSGRRYVVGIHPLDEVEIRSLTEAVILAVMRDPDGTAHVIDVATAGSRSGGEARTRWMDAVRDRGATELHVHRLAEGEDERRAVIEDLREEA
ncbi:MAG TPA: hypothetical protein VHL98_05815 [Microvirga sp.]|jgi:hypothetical protein|nr:hypothetical protein [Microvirga sp.]